METKQPEENLFTSLWPGMMKHTRLLFVDYDVMRFHSFDMLLRQIVVDRRNEEAGGFKHFASLQTDLFQVVDTKRDLVERIYHAQRCITDLNIYNLFYKEPPIIRKPKTIREYEYTLQNLFADKMAPCNRTEIGVRMGLVFNRSDITGYILRYPDDPYYPNYIDQLTVIEDPHVLDVDIIADTIQKHKINAVVIADMGTALKVSHKLIQDKYTDPISWITGQYGYNYIRSDSGTLYPKYADVCYNLELVFQYEFATFDPYGGLASNIPPED